jgi:phage terminase large subunit GpA-like protein
MVDSALLDRTYETLWRPPREPRTHLAYARSMLLPDGPSAGETWEPDTEPMQAVATREMENQRWQVIVLVWPSQRGKSLTGVALPMLHTITELRQNCAYVMPNLEKLEQNWHGKIAPMIDGCGFSAWLPKKGPGSQGGKPAVLVLRDPSTSTRVGTLYFLAAGGGGKETSLSAVSTPIVVGDEMDDLESEGQLSLLFRRTRSFGEDYRIYLTSTVNERKNRDAHPILVAFERGTRTRLHYQCHLCSKYQPLEFEQIKYDDIEARYQCIHCQGFWTEAELKRVRQNYREVHAGQEISAEGVISGPEPSGRIFSLIGSDLDFNRASMWSMVTEYRNAKKSIDDRGDHSAMRQFYHKVLCRDYRADLEELETGVELTWQSLLARSQQAKWGVAIHTTDKSAETPFYTYSRHVTAPPPEAAFVVAGVDVQHDRIYAEASAYGLDNTSYDIAWSYQYARDDRTPWNRGELFQLLDSVDLWLRKISSPLPLYAVGLDVGDSTDDLMRWLQSRKDNIWKATKGAPGNLKDEPGDIDGLVHIRDGLFLLDTGNLRELIHAGYRRPVGTVGSINLPSGLQNNPTNRAYPQHLCAERLILDQKTRKPKVVRGPGRWDWQDARRITHAMALLQLRKITRPKPKRHYGVIAKLGN